LGIELGGIAAVDIATGESSWFSPAPVATCSWEESESASTMRANLGLDLRCTASQPAGLVATPGVVFSGSIDGHVRAHSTEDGTVVWDFDTGRTFKGVNGAEATGGSMNYGAIVAANGMLFVTSGSGGLHQAGNALIAFSVDGE
jgi:polyvinyl alcohol dehydrogenase (cytochrome)